MIPSRPLLLSLLAAAAACAGGAAPTECGRDDQCAAGARCTAGVCAAAPPPVAAVRAPAATEAFLLVELDGSGSHDPSGGAVVEHRFTLRGGGEGCAPPVVAGGEALARVRFPCPGRYEVALVVVNDLGLASAPATALVEVLPSSRPPAIVTGPDLVVGHRCEGVPLRCAPTEPITLAAEAGLPGVSLRWTVEAPVGREGGTPRLVPGPEVPCPAVELASGGEAISGDWVFRVEARDAHGVVGVGLTRVSVLNRPPVVLAEAPAPLPHRFDPAGSRFLAEGEVRFSVHDPDGDPVDLSITARHAGDGGARFEAIRGEGTVRLEVEVPYLEAGDALRLRGGEGLARSLELVARDVNRTAAVLSVPIEIANRPPVQARPPAALAVAHRFDPASARYLASAALGAWSDPDGDPLAVAAGAAPCAGLRLEDGEVRVECAVAYDGVPAVHRLAGPRPVTVRVRDPWELAAAAPTYVVQVENRAPEVARTVDLPGLGVRVSVSTLPGCLWSVLVHPAAFRVQFHAVDPEGDPLLVRAGAAGGTASPPEQVCAGAPCVPVAFAQPAQHHPCWTAASRLTYVPASWMSASDGLAQSAIPVSPPLAAP